MLIKALKDLNKPSTEELPKSKDAESDSDTLFCQSLISTLKSLGPEENMKAKMQIQQLLFTLKFRLYGLEMFLIEIKCYSGIVLFKEKIYTILNKTYHTF